MRILILTQWYPPEPAVLMHEMAQELQLLGHQVQVLTGFPNYPDGILHEGYALRPWMREELDSIEVIRTYLYPNHSQSGVKRVLNYLSFALSTSILGLFLVQRPDVLFVYHPPITVAIPAWLLSRLWRIPFTFQIQDMWPETLTATGMINNKRILTAIAKFAQVVYQKAALVFVISDGFRRNLIDKGVRKEKIEVVSNWVDTKAYFPDIRDEDYADELGLSSKFNVMFAGNMGEAQALETVMETAERLQDEYPDIQFVFVGSGIAVTHLHAMKTEKGLDNVRFLGRFRPEEMPRLYALADVLLLHLKDEALFRITIPHKVFAYMASQKPVLAAVTGDAAAVIDEANAGFSCPPQNPAALAAVVLDMAAMDADELAQLGYNGRQQVVSHYNRSFLVKQIEEALISVVGKL